MFTPKKNSILATPNSARVTRSQSLKSKNELFSPIITPSGALNRSLLGNSIYNDNILESYKAPLPIKINEIIFQLKSKENVQLIATILNNGHVCLAYEKKLYIWKLKKSFKNIQCYELTMPPSRSMLIKQNCIHIDCHDNKDYIGICATVEGFIRYWPSIFNQYLCVDTKIDLAQNDEVSHLAFINENLYLIVTSNGNLWSVTIENLDGRITPLCKQIDSSSGLLSSVGRRMTSLIFGGGSSSLNKNSQNFKSFLRYKNASEIYLLVDKNLQKWRINSDNTLTMVSQTNLEKLFYEEYLAQNVDSVRIGITFQDASITKNSIYVMAMIEDDGHKFVIGEIDTFNRSNDLKLKVLHILNYNLNKQDTQKQFKMYAIDNQHAFYIYNPQSVISFTGPTLEMSGESKFNTLGDKIIASNFVDSDLVFFSLNHGIIKTKDNSFRLSIEEENSINLAESNQSLDGSYSTNLLGSGMRDFHPHVHEMTTNMSLQSPADDMSFRGRPSFDFSFTNVASSDQMSLNRLKEAFQCYLKKEERDSQALIEEIFRSTANEKKLDFLCISLSEKLIDDMPAHDPRWAEFNPNKSKSLNTNVIISNQLKGKIKLHEYYLMFLKKFQLLDKLRVVNYNGRDIQTKLALLEHGEKLQMAITIRDQLYLKNQEFINQAIEFTIKNRDDPQKPKFVYPHDLFYRKVSKIDDIFNALFMIESEVIKVNSNDQAINYLIDAITFFSKLLKVSQSYRQEKSRMYELQSTNEPIEYIRWTFLPVKELINSTPSVINICIKQHKLSSEFGLINCSTLENKSNILQSLFEMDSLIFEEHELRLNSFDTSAKLEDFELFKSKYDLLKAKLNEVYLKQKQIENAIKLSEQYIDFHTLVYICELKSDADLLESYLDRYANLNFAEFVVNYFKEKKKLNFLLKNQFLKRADVSACLDKYDYLAWIKDLKNEKFEKASETLELLGLNEIDSFMKQKTLISLSKLSLIAEKTSRNIGIKLAALNRCLDYLAYCEYIAPEVNRKYGLHIDQIPVYKANKLIELFIKKEDANEVDFNKAYELVHFLNEDKNMFYDDEKIAAFRVEILVHSILSDNWEILYEQDYPENYLNETKFFKTLHLIRQGGESLESILELKETMLQHELLQHLTSNNKFFYLVQACFELLASC